MNTTSPKSPLSKLGFSKKRTLRVMIIGHDGVGKTAMIVRFITKRFIGDYDPNAQKIYTFRYHVDNEDISYEITDGSGLLEKHERLVEADLRRTDAFIIMYSVTDKCRFDDTSRLKFLITYAKSRKKVGKEVFKDLVLDAPVLLVGNKCDQHDDRMVTIREGQERYKKIFCESFHEISVRESYEEVCNVLEDVCRHWREFKKSPKLKRSRSDVQNGGFFVISPELGRFYFGSSFRREKCCSQSEFNKSDDCLSPKDIEEIKTKNSDADDQNEPFRSRACTDGTILTRLKRYHLSLTTAGIDYLKPTNRRMSISLRDSNSSDDDSAVEKKELI